MEKRIFGLENEYSVCERSEKGFISVAGNSVFPPWFIGLKENPVIKKYKLCSGIGTEIIDGWLGANGGRFYLDINGKYIPEYATPECDSPRMAAIHDKAGEMFLHELQTAIAKEYEERNKRKPHIVIISKNTTVSDSGPLTTTYVGAHENYLYKNSIFLKEEDKTNLKNFLGP
ncbi:MAG: proteasome accessory factor PafA2 family protein, partial [Candidatus Sungbacteria bacterium]|nr:proteasome accessory factor PafA2 family protein [Candidatus Sungbacteria bacterium]